MMTQVWLSAAGLSLATVIGALIGFGIKELPHKWNDAVLGFCAGIMLAAATLGLIVPAVEQAVATEMTLRAACGRAWKIFRNGTRVPLRR